METANNEKYLLYKTASGGESRFIKVCDDDAVNELRHRADNRDLLISTWYSEMPDISSPRNYALCFHIVANNIETARVSAIEAIYYIEECFGIPVECIEIIYTGAGCRDGGGDDGGGIKNGADGGGDVRNKGGDSGKTGQSVNNTATAVKVDKSSAGSNDAREGILSAEIIISIAPVVFSSSPTSLMPAINYHLSRQMVEDGMNNINVDSCLYLRDSYMSLPNSINSITSRFVIPLTLKELMFADINELSKQPRPDDSLIQPSEIPEAIEWFAGVLADFEKEQHRQDEPRKLVLKNGWQIPSCIRRLTWADLDKNMAFEACRLISGTYPFLGSNEEEIRYHVMRLARRNSITGFKEYQKLKNIVTYGVENPMLAECKHPLMSRLCPSGWCFMTELIEEYEKPLLFQ